MPDLLPLRPAALTPGLKPRGYRHHGAADPRWPLLILLGALASACAGPAKPAAPAQPPDVVLITVDTLRADRVGGALTPAINAVGASGARFLAARTTAPLTLPAHVSLMTGSLPTQTGVRLNGVHRFDDSRPTLARLFKDAGRETAAFVGAFVLDRQFGLASGFDTYDDQIARAPDAPLRLEAERSASAVAGRAIAWLRRRAQEGGAARRPYFLWAHFYDPHAPYAPPPDALARAGGDAYGGEVAYADAEIGRLLRAVAGHGAGRPVITVILGDHGESLGEHGERTHGMLLYDGAARIPLVIAGPGVTAGERRQAVSIADVAPTLLRLSGLTIPAGLPAMWGRDLFSTAARGADTYIETMYPRVMGWSGLTALVEDRWKVTVAEGAGSELYDLANDPGERANAAGSRPEIVQAASARLAGIASAQTASAPAAASAEAQERLRALGYVGSAPPPPPGAGTRGVNPAARIATWVAFEEAIEQLNSGRAALALAALAALHKANPGAQVIATTYANALTAQGRHREALAIYRRAVAEWPGDTMLFHDLAVAAQRAGLHDEAARAEQAAIALDPKNAAAHNGLGLMLIEQGRAGEAAQAFERASAADPSSAEYLANLGNARRAVNDARGAEAAYRAAIAADPASANGLNGLGVLLVESGRASEAVAVLERATASDPGLWEARLNLGIAYQTAGNLDAAAVAYRAVLAAPSRFARERKAAGELLASLDRKR
jgi:arylsulfatase A-like enzyme/Flp pilus assembly protein TadD